MAATLAKLLSVRELARERGVTPQTIRNWLRRLDARTGGAVIVREGNGPNAPMKTTLRALRDADARYVETRDLEVERIAVELRRVNGARIDKAVRAAVRDIASDVENRVERLERSHSKQLQAFQLLLPMQSDAKQCKESDSIG